MNKQTKNDIVLWTELNTDSGRKKDLGDNEITYARDTELNFVLSEAVRLNRPLVVLTNPAFGFPGQYYLKGNVNDLDNIRNTVFNNYDNNLFSYRMCWIR